MGKSQKTNGAPEKEALKELLKPLEDATHRRDQKTAPPQVSYLPGTRKELIKKISNWAGESNLTASNHICWVFGGTGCGKSTIAQEMAERLDQKKKLAGSYFWSRSSEERSTATTLVATLAYQLANAVPKTAPYIEAALVDEPELLQTFIPLPTQLNQLVYGPCKAVFKKGSFLKPLTGSKGPFVFVLDGVDECQDAQRILDFLDSFNMFFKENPTIPIRILISGRITDTLTLRADAPGVQLIDLADSQWQHGARVDVSAYIRATFSKRHEVLKAAGTPPEKWPSPSDISKLDDIAQGSFAIAVPLVEFLLQPSEPTLGTGPLPQARFDAFCAHVLTPAKDLPHFLDVLSAMALLKTPVSVSGLAKFIGTYNYAIMNVLSQVSGIIAVPGRDRDIPLTFISDDAREYLLVESRSHDYHAQSSVLKLAAFNYLDLAMVHFESLPEDQWLSPLPEEIYTANTSWPKHLELIAEADPGFDVTSFDGRFTQILSRLQFLPHFTTFLAILALYKRSVQLVHVCAILQVDVADLSQMICGLAPLIFRKSHDPYVAVTIGDRIGFRHRAIADFLFDKERAGRLHIEPCQYTYLTQRYMDIVFGLPISFVNDKSFFVSWPWFLSRAVVEDPMFERDYIEEQYNPVRVHQRAQVDSLQGWRDAITIYLEPEELDELILNVECAIDAIERQFPGIFTDVEDTFLQAEEGKGKKNLVLASRTVVAVVDILYGFRKLLAHTGHSSRLCIQRGCGTGVQIERYIGLVRKNRFFISLYRCGPAPAPTSPSASARHRASAMIRSDTAPLPQRDAGPSSSTRPEGVRRADSTPLIRFDGPPVASGSGTRRDEEDVSIPAPSGRALEDSPPAAGSLKLPRDSNSTEKVEGLESSANGSGSKVPSEVEKVEETKSVSRGPKVPVVEDSSIVSPPSSNPFDDPVPEEAASSKQPEEVNTSTS